jgi:hypothetical protein
LENIRVKREDPKDKSHRNLQKTSDKEASGIKGENLKRRLEVSHSVLELIGALLFVL